MKATISKLYRDDKISVWGEAYDKRGKVYIEVDSKSARYAQSEYSNVVALKSACEYAPEINKWWLALA
jgi:hypothetical protein